MPGILLATSRAYPALTESDSLLAETLRSRGLTVRGVPWQEIGPDDVEDAVICLRSTWDYHLQPEAFRRWISALDAQPGRLWNPAVTVQWNADKVYLRGLSEAGVRIPGTHWIEPGRSVDLPALFRQSGWPRAVLKPRVSASAHGTELVTPDSVLGPEDRARLERGGALFQEFLAEVTTAGEISLVFLAGHFSHAARKSARPGEFRVQPHLGGTAEPYPASESLVRFGAGALAAAGRPWLYARVDVVEAESGPVLMELELIEPELFLGMAPPGAVDRLAAALHARLREAVLFSSCDQWFRHFVP